MSPELRAHSLDAAERAVRRERRRLVDERRAFEEFTERVRGFDAERPRTTGGQTLVCRQSGGLDAVRDAYEETVMSVPHYRDEYDEPYAVNVAGELSQELAAALGSDGQFHPPLKRRLIEATGQAIAGRERLIGVVDAEAAALESAEDDIAALTEDVASLGDQPLASMEFNALRLTRERLRDARDRCDDLAADRQSTLQDQRPTLPVEIDDLGEYLYADCETAYPLLAAFADLRRRIDRLLREIDRRLARAG
ncbi:DUF7260 family protein [Natronoarchaeum rubrum]|uniref:DUF7260 family protein n=1 Tax=Natronoarchaeum rubrum TaxID=755311 RepID=UPI002112A49E|nr:hypothetical protein [Natronoarchaeum rubrum]